MTHEKSMTNVYPEVIIIQIYNVLPVLQDNQF